MGKSILAFLPDEERTGLLDQLTFTFRTPHTITDKAALIEELKTVRAQGFATDREESEEDVNCVGAPIFDRSGRPFAAISISGPAYRLSISRLSALSSLVIDTANSISSQLGYAP
jgi:DNA-binding IclR family transcriptional regulator